MKFSRYYGTMIVLTLSIFLILGVQNTTAATSDSVTISGYILSQEKLEANFSARPVSGTVPLTVRFTDTSTGKPTAWRWDFTNDGSVDSFARNPSFTYPRAGTYSVRLRVVNAEGSDTETKTAYITVTPSAAEEKITALNRYVDHLSLHGWSKWILLSSLRSTSHDLEDGNDRLAVNHMREFIQEVRWMRWVRIIPKSQADYLTGEAEAIISLIQG
jgi:PKD repeat protein